MIWKDDAGTCAARALTAEQGRSVGTAVNSDRRMSRAALLTRTRNAVSLLEDETGSATAEYAVATMAAVGFAGLLVLILRGDEVRGILTDLVRRALTVAN